MYILGIETSCDETAAAVVKDGTQIITNIVASSQKIHQKYGGIVPEIAARKQIDFITPVVKEALAEIPHEEIDALAVTVGPGLIGSLLVGVEFAKTLSYLWQKPIIPVNHLIGHIYANFLIQSSPSTSSGSRVKSGEKLKVKDATNPKTVELPALVLIVSGGHTELVLMKDHGVFENIGGTRDDAAGEAFDKAARLLNLGYPGGPAIQKAAEKGNPKAFNLPRPLINSPDFDFSFSGLKTALYQTVQQITPTFVPLSGTSAGRPAKKDDATSQETSDLAASFQQAAIDCLVHKTTKAAQKYEVMSVLLAGGVAANKGLREGLGKAIQEKLPAISFFMPPFELCTDNATCIAAAAYFNYKPKPWSKIKAEPGLDI